MPYRLLSEPKSFTRRRYLLLDLLILLLLLVGTGWRAPVQAYSSDFTPAATATMHFTQSTYTVNPNTSVIISLVIDTAETMGGWEAELVYDPTRVTVTNVTPGAFLGSTGRTTGELEKALETGRLAVGGYSYNNQPAPSGSGELAQITLQIGSVTGQTPITLENATVGSIGSPQTVQAQDLTVQSTILDIIDPLAATVANFEATSQADGVALLWQTTLEQGLQRFDIWRGTTSDAPETPLGSVAATGAGSGALYQWLDETAPHGTTSFYWLALVDVDGSTRLEGPVSVFHQTPTAVTLNSATITSTGIPWTAAGWLVLLIVLAALLAYQWRKRLV